MLFSALNGEPLAVINDGVLQNMREAAGGGIGAKYLARKNAKTVGILGSGDAARDYLQAYCAVRDIRSVKVYSPNKADSEAYANEMSRRFHIEVVSVDSVEEAVRGADFVSSCTYSLTPTIDAEWLSPGQYVTMHRPTEISKQVIERCEVKISQGSGGLRVEGKGIEQGRGLSPMAWIAGSEEERKRLPPKRGNADRRD